MNGLEDLDDDEALRLAIAISLDQDPLWPRQGSADDFNSIVSSESIRDEASSTDSVPKLHGSSAPVHSSSASTILGMDRRKMEAERLERVKKRKAAEEFSENSFQPAHRIKTNGRKPDSISGSEESKQTQYPPKSPREDNTVVDSQAFSASTSENPLPYPQGTIKKTWALGQPRLGDDIKIEEIFQKNSVELAVLSSFQWDDAWLLSKLDISRTKVVLIAYAADEAQRQEMRSNVPRDKIRFCFPPMQGPGCMHSKLQLLKYKDYLRIVIPTGNLVPYDWGETGVMENMVFIMDLPKIQDPDRGVSNKLTFFGEELCRFLSAQDLDEKLVQSLKKYDFSETERYAFVHSIAGSHHTYNKWKSTGYCGLGRAVNALGLASDGPVHIDFVCSSVGSLNIEFLKAFYFACQGDSGLKEYNSRITKSKAKDCASTTDDESMVLDNIRVYFPSHDTVLHSRGGINAAGTLCFQPQWWNSARFPRDTLRDCKSTRSGLLMHNKVVFVRRPQVPAGASGSGFAYVGSANFSESAWGRLVKERTSDSPKLTCRNWECGVLVRTTTPASPSMSPGDKLAGDAQDRSDNLSLFTGLVPVPMQYPGTPFTSKDSKHALSPWFSQSRHG